MDFEFNRIKLPVSDRIFFLSLRMENARKLLQKRSEEKGLVLDMAEKNETHQALSYKIATEILPECLPDYYIIPCEDQNGVILPQDAICEKILSEIL